MFMSSEPLGGRPSLYAIKGNIRAMAVALIANSIS